MAQIVFNSLENQPIIEIIMIWIIICISQISTVIVSFKPGDPKWSLQTPEVPGIIQEFIEN